MNILLTAFRGTSSELLLKDIKNCQTIFLPNDMVKDSEILIDTLAWNAFDFVISFGQRPNIKDKVHVETTAKNGEMRIDTTFDCEMLIKIFGQNDIPAKLSHNAGTSFCNRLYWNCLQYITENKLETKMVFVHMPFAKNIREFELFRERMFAVVKYIESI